MFTHHGEERTHKHNLQVASLLAFVAGMVNITGFFALQRLTTNITGHFAFFMSAVFRENLSAAIVFMVFILAFFLGSMASSFLIEYRSRRIESSRLYYLPVMIEAGVLIGCGLLGTNFINHSPDLLAVALLFAMGWQNSLVTKISNSMVRTTHLTGLFTDLGIELSQLLFYREETEQQSLRSSIRLRLLILVFFFGGGACAGLTYGFLHLWILIGGGILLLAGLIIQVK